MIERSLNNRTIEQSNNRTTSLSKSKHHCQSHDQYQYQYQYQYSASTSTTDRIERIFNTNRNRKPKKSNLKSVQLELTQLDSSTPLISFNPSYINQFRNADLCFRSNLHNGAELSRTPQFKPRLSLTRGKPMALHIHLSLPLLPVSLLNPSMVPLPLSLLLLLLLPTIKQLVHLR